MNVYRQIKTAPISADEQARRQYAIDFARGSVRMEGFVLDAQTEALFADYVAGKLDSSALDTAILEYCGVATA
ncbi:antitoxin VbhA family protein [Sphingomonas sp. CFBP 13603]|uniref:antitoxin VbhA family protein n=1 Tax=Sphingomonas sp. CFBP 13603 TaxID=2774040 RepID=UPI0018663A98|nr:antitoxin VbhA family protein [Sphingomonas sp. CFBP 13603]MBE2993053.1 antitoxin VbhA family protein [Sphingomonas sp. CFBP 13603]